MEAFIILIALLLSGFFSGIEIAYVTANKLKIELRIKQGSFMGKMLQLVTESPSKFLGTTLIGNNVALIILGFMMASILEPAIKEYLPTSMATKFAVMLIQTIITTALVLVFGEFIPKALFRLNPNRLLTAFSLPLMLTYFLLYPLIHLVLLIANFTLKYVLRVDYQETKPVFSKVDLGQYFNQFVANEEEEEDLNKEIFEKALYLTQVKARECMVPRTEIIAIEVKSSIQELTEKLVESKLSRIIVYNENIDNILGYAHHFDLLKKPSSLHEILFPIKAIPESMPAKDILNMLIKDHKSVAWVVDEFGGTAGIVTLEDVQEEIFGEIKDEYDTEDFIEKQIFDNEFIFSGRLEIDYINEKYNINLPEGDYETLAGYIVSNHEDIPDNGEEIVIDQFNFKILNVSETRIETVKLKIEKPTEEQP